MLKNPINDPPTYDLYCPSFAHALTVPLDETGTLYMAYSSLSFTQLSTRILDSHDPSDFSFSKKTVHFLQNKLRSKTKQSNETGSPQKLTKIAQRQKLLCSKKFFREF